MYTSKSLAGVINQFTASKNIDTFQRHLRSKCLENIDQLEEKSVERDNISCTMKNPFALAGLKQLTRIQVLMNMFCKKHMFEKLGSIAVQASCGSGKTLTGLYVMRNFQCKTLIISTRCAVIDQWYNVSSKLYPDLKIYTNERKIKRQFKDISDADMWIVTPQFLNTNSRIEEASDFNIKPSLIIYDEIHTMLSLDSKNREFEYLNVLKYPFIRCMQKAWSELPYMLALSATYPEKPTNIERMFGNIYYEKCESVTSIPISVYDLRDCWTDKMRGNCDTNYQAFNQ